MQKFIEEFSNGIFVYPNSNLNTRSFRDVPKRRVVVETKDKVQESDDRLRFLDPRTNKNELLGFVKPRPKPRFIESLMGKEYQQVNPFYKNIPGKNNTDVLGLESNIKPIRKRRLRTNEDVLGNTQFFTGSTNVSSFENDEMVEELEENSQKGTTKKILIVIGLLMIFGIVIYFFSRRFNWSFF